MTEEGKEKLSEQYPDLPVVSYHQLLTWDRCRFLWKLKHIDKWDRSRKGYRMELGTMGHALLFDWYKTGLDHSEEFAATWLKDWEGLDGEQIQNINTAVAQFKLYRELFSPQYDKDLTTEFLEHHFEVIMETPQGRKFILQGYIDRGSRDSRGRLWLEDYKWTGRFWSPIQLLMDMQLSYYAIAMILLGYDVYGLMITQVNTYPYKAETRAKKKVDELFKRETFHRSQAELQNGAYEVGLMMDEMLQARENPEGTFRRSLRNECDKCDFQEPCLMGLKGVDPQGFMAMSNGFQKRVSRKPTDREGGIPELTRDPIRPISNIRVEGNEVIFD